MPRRKGTGDKIPYILMILRRLGKATVRDILDNGLGQTGTHLKNAQTYLNRAVAYGFIKKVSATEYAVVDSADIPMPTIDPESDDLGPIDFHGRVKDTSKYPKQDPHILSQIWR